MLQITKGAPPACLDVLRRTPGSTWKSVHGDQKAEMRRAALAEQGGLCAYCTRRIRGQQDEQGAVDCTIEHWSARSGGADPFHWPDMLGVCTGKTSGVEHCDTARGDRPLQLHPTQPGLEERVRYLGDGRVEIDRRLANGQVKPNGHSLDIKTLNLDAIPLRQGRRQVIEAVLRQASSADATRLRAMISAWEGRDNEGNRPEYAGVALYLLRRALRVRESKSTRVRGRVRA